MKKLKKQLISFIKKKILEILKIIVIKNVHNFVLKIKLIKDFIRNFRE